MITEGKLIVFEGVDGSGKSTQAHLLVRALEDNGIKATYIHFPRIDNERSIYGKFIKAYLRGELGSKERIDPYFIAFLYAGDRREMKEEICHYLSRGVCVVLDRYVFSNIAYQGARLPEKEKSFFIEWVLFTEFKTFGLPKPQLTIWLDMPMDFCLKNISTHRVQKDRATITADIHEKDVAFQQQVREMYHRMFTHEKNVFTLTYERRQNVPSPEKIHRVISQQFLFL